MESEGQAPFHAKADVLLAGKQCCGGAGSRANAAADQSALTAPSQCADQCASTGAPANPSQVALLVRAAAGDDAGGRNRNALLSKGDTVEGQSDLAGMMQT